MSYKAAFAFVIWGGGYGVLRLFNGFVFLYVQLVDFRV